MSTPQKGKARGVPGDTPDLEFHPSTPAFAQLLVTESVDRVQRHGTQGLQRGWEAVGDDLASC